MFKSLDQRQILVHIEQTLIPRSQRSKFIHIALLYTRNNLEIRGEGLNELLLSKN